MTNLNFLVSLVIATSVFIVVGIGHGMLPIIIFEFVLIPSYFNGLASSLGGDNLVAFTSSGFLGHTLLLLGIYSKKPAIKSILILFGGIFLALFVLYFAIGFSENAAPRLTRILSVPTLILTLCMFYRLYKINARKSTDNSAVLH